MRRIIINTISLLLILTQFIFVLPNMSIPKIEANAVGIDGGISNIELKPTFSAPRVNLNQTATVTYDNINSLDYDLECVADGIEAVLIEDKEYLEIEIRGITNEEFGTLTVNAVDADGTILTNTVYTYNNGVELHISDFGKDQAWYQGVSALYNMNTDTNTYITENECIERYCELTEDCSEVIDTAINYIGDLLFTKLTGYVYWETSGTPVSGSTENPYLPMRNTKIEAMVKIGGIYVPVGGGYTDEDGYYEITVLNSDWYDDRQIYIRIHLEAHTFNVASDWFFDHYYYTKAVERNIEEGSEICSDIKIKHRSDMNLYKATYVQQGMVIAERFARKMGFETNRIIQVAYPGGILDSSIDGQLVNSAFCGGNFFGASYSVIGIDSYNDTQMLVHEYSHYVQMSLGNYGATLAEIIEYWPDHPPEKDLFTYKKDKEFAMHLAWSEAWGYAFSVMAQLYYKDDYIGMNNYELNINNPSPYQGEFQQNSVEQFLWELLDQNKIAYDRNANTSNAPAEELDYQLPWTPQEWWNMTTVPGTCRFPDFMRLIEEEGYDESMDIDYKALREDIAYYLTKYNIAPQINSITYTSSTPTINLMVNGSEAYPNNRLAIKIFDENNNLLAESDMIEVNRGRFENFNLSIPDDLWSEVLSKCSCTDGQATNLKISVEGYREDTTDPDGTAIENQFRKTGPYYSEYEELPITHEHTYSSVNEATHNRYCSGCGTTTVQPHRFVYAKFNDAMHSARCADCGYFQLMSHNMVFGQVDGRYHKHYCSNCGYSEGNSLHVLKSNGSTDRYQNCTACGALVDTGINMFPIIKNKIEEEEYTE